VTAQTDRLNTALAGRYRILRQLGEGGMATVYLCEDLKHDRQVALKLLKPELAAVLGAERFVQEIKTTAALQHPHILPLFDSGAADGFLFYVMPFIDGETLRAKLDRETQLGVDDAVRIAREVADALDYAHTRGIVHRDVKPENILLHGGHAMVADFGIALAVSAAAGGRMTETGLSLGTPHYMSPEQATAEKEITPRSDVYSIGSVLYEMLTGNAPFTGANAQQIIMKIITVPAESVTMYRKSVPANVAAAVAKSLEKLPADRFASAAEFAAALGNESFATASGARRAASGASAQGVSRSAFGALAALAVVLLVAAVIGWMRPQPAAATSRQRVVLWEVGQPSLLTPGIGTGATQAAIAPDGSSIVFVDSVGGRRLWRKLRHEVTSVPLTGTEGALSPFFSPDGAWVGYATEDGRLRKVPTAGGSAITIAEDANDAYYSGAWLGDDSIIYIGRSRQLRRAAAAGGASRAVPIAGTDGVLDIVTLSPLPHSRGVLFTACAGNCSISSSVYGFRFGSDSATLLVPDAASAWVVPGGYLVYTSRAGGLFAARFDPDRLELVSGAVPVIDGISPGHFAVSASGSALYTVGGEGGGDAELVWVNRDGRAVSVDSSWRGRFEYPAISPNGDDIAVSLSGRTTDLWVWRSGGLRQKLTKDGSVNWRPFWASDGRSLIYSSSRGASEGTDAYAIFRKRVDSDAPPELVLRRPTGIWEAELSRDSAWLVFRTDDEGGVSNIRARRLRGDTTVVDVAVDAAYKNQVALSPDGRWLAFGSVTAGQRWEIYVTAFPDRSSTRLVSRDGGTEPRWSRDGRELFFKSRGNLVAVSVPPGPVFAPGAPRVLFPVTAYRAANNRQQYDVSPDGQRFLMIRDLRGNASGTVVYVENWLDELKAKVKP
jgi:Tol biopolymer transport system component